MVFLNKGRNFRRCPRRDHAAAHNHERALRAHDLRRCLRRADDKVRVRLPRCIDTRFLGRIGDLFKEEIARHINQHRSRASAARELKCLADRRHEIRRILDLIVMLRHGHRHIKDIRLLERIAAEHGDIHLPRDRNQWDRVHIRRRKSRDEICRARSRCRDADADAARCACIAVRRVCGILLMRHEDLTNLLLSVESIIKRQDHPARIAEQRVHALLPQTCQNRLCTSHARRTLLKFYTNDKSIIAYTHLAGQDACPGEIPHLLILSQNFLFSILKAKALERY